MSYDKYSNMEEDEVYIAAKAFFTARGWTLLAGQPPNGSDHLPVVEIKLRGKTRIGSKGALKPDLIAHSSGIFAIVEAKSEHSDSDAQKLREVLNDEHRIQLLYQEMKQRHLFERHRIAVDNSLFRNGLVGVLAHAGPPVPQSDLVSLVFEETGAIRQVLIPNGFSEDTKIAFMGTA